MPLSYTLSVPFSSLLKWRQAAVLSGVVGQGVHFPKDATHFRCMHHATFEPSRPSWVHTFASACLSGRCYSPGTASSLADSQRLTGYLVYPEGLPVSLDPSSISSYSFHGAHMECTTCATGSSAPRLHRYSVSSQAAYHSAWIGCAYGLPIDIVGHQH